MYMKQNSRDIVCMQETRCTRTDTFTLDAGYWALLSGAGSNQQEWAGVGFVGASHSRKYVIGFNPFSNRAACVKIRVKRGVSSIFSLYASHNLKPLAERQLFYDNLETHIQKLSPTKKAKTCWKLLCLDISTCSNLFSQEQMFLRKLWFFEISKGFVWQDPCQVMPNTLEFHQIEPWRPKTGGF